MHVKSVSNKKTYAAAVIGCGRIGVTMEGDSQRTKPATHAGAFSSSPLTKLCALVDPMPTQLERAQSIFADVPTFTDVEAMLKQYQPEIVSIATPPDQHRLVVESCARHRVRAIVCEKPIALTRSDGEAMIRACRQADSLLFINHTRRFDRLLQQTGARVGKGELGELFHGSCYYTAGLFNTATHLVDMLRFLTNREVKWVSAVPESRFSAPEGDVNVNGWLMCEDDLLISLQALEVKQYAIFEAHLYGSKGAVTVDRFGYSVEWSRVVDCPDFQGYKEIDRVQKERVGSSRSFFADLVQHVVDCLEGRSQPLSTGEDGLAALHILTALRESARQNGKRIDLKESNHE
jgi:predicted dehydrogenase